VETRERTVLDLGTDPRAKVADRLEKVLSIRKKPEDVMTFRAA
jgi:hypothetical protein